MIFLRILCELRDEADRLKVSPSAKIRELGERFERDVRGIIFDMVLIEVCDGASFEERQKLYEGLFERH